MKKSKTQSPVWSVINWGQISQNIKEELGLSPDKESIANAIEQIEKEYKSLDLFSMEVVDLENLLQNYIMDLLRKNYKNEIKRSQRQKIRQTIRKEEKGSMQQHQPQVRVLGIEDMEDMDPAILDQIQKGIMDKYFKEKKKNKGDDEDDEDRNNSFYL